MIILGSGREILTGMPSIIRMQVFGGYPMSPWVTLFPRYCSTESASATSDYMYRQIIWRLLEKSEICGWIQNSIQGLTRMMYPIPSCSLGSVHPFNFDLSHLKFS